MLLITDIKRALFGRSFFGFNGQEKKDDYSGAGNHNNALFWEYDTRLGRRWNRDPKPNPSISDYATFTNNPILKTDVNGDFSINNHYDFTHSALKMLNFSDVAADLVSHYASVYADHPSNNVMKFEGQKWRQGYNYTKTGNSQDSKSSYNSSWHSMKADGEKISNGDAMKRGQTFGWGKIIASADGIAKAGGIGKLKPNDAALQDLGQGIHALQDAIAHKGINLSTHLLPNHLYNDSYPSDADKDHAIGVAKTGVIVAEVLAGIKEHVTDGMVVDLTGATKEQFNTIKSAFQSVINESAGKIKTIIFKGGTNGN